MNCVHCGKPLRAETRYCPHCGGRLAKNGSHKDRLAQTASKNADSSDEVVEKVLWQGTYSKYAMIGVWVGAAIASLASIILGLYMGRSARWGIIIPGNLVIWLAIVGRYFYMRLSRHYSLTSQRFTHVHGLLWRQTDRIEVIDIDDVAFTQGPVERIFGIGTIRITSSDQSHPELMLQGIEDVQSVANLIDDARRKERRKRGLYIESV